MKTKLLLFATILLFILSSARQLNLADYLNLPVTPYNYTITLPTYFTTNAAGGGPPTSINGLDNTPSNNPITNDGATLGRVLFYDKNLSLNRTVACASCHKQTKGFSDDAVLSVGFAGGLTGRHSMTLIDSKYYQRGRFFWDERAATLEVQVLQPIQDATEMGLTLPELLQRVSEQSYYPQLFVNAFGDNIITTDRISRALAQFVRSIESYQSKYDTGRASVNNLNQNFPNFTADENAGKTLFLRPIANGGAGCFVCHTTEAFVSLNAGPQSNGLDATITDVGAGATFPNQQNLRGRFKMNTLRNIELTAPYMHDGRFSTLEQVVEHYNSGIQASPNLSPQLRDGQGNPVRLNLSTLQKSQLVAFMKTLTDNTVANEVRWSNPFVACQTDLVITGTTNSGTYKSSNSISAQSGNNQTNSNINLDAGRSILINPPYEIKSGTVFKAQIGGCN